MFSTSSQLSSRLLSSLRAFLPLACGGAWLLSVSLLSTSILDTSFAVAGEAVEEDADGDAENTEIVFQDDFESGMARWDLLSPATWELKSHDGNHTMAITARESAYVPPVRSPYHVALAKGVELGSFEITFRVRSTKDTGNHRDCCVFFNYVDDQHFYYVHLGAKPDPNSGQIMIVKEAPRLALTENERLVPWDNEWHDVRVVRDVESGSIKVYFDDMQTPHMQVNDKRFTHGRIGIGSFDDMNEFDDVVIRSR